MQTQKGIQDVHIPSLDERVARAEKSNIGELFYCKDIWAVRHYWINTTTGEKQRARCNRWECLYCGPRKVNLWRQLVKEADPTLFLTLSKAGNTVEAAARALTTFMQALRRGSKGKGPNRIGARVAYPVEYFAVLERHRDFERNGFHWHLLLKGVERVPYKEVIQPLWASATHYDEATGEGANIGHIERIRNAKAIGYVTKYLTKALSVGERGKRDVERERVAVVRDAQGHAQLYKEVVIEQVTSKAHRVRYSREFFPERVAALRARLFAGVEHETEGQEDNGKPLEDEDKEEGSKWILCQHASEETTEIEGFKQQRYGELAEGLEDLRDSDPIAYERHKKTVSVQIWEESRGLALEEYHQLRRKALREAIEDNKPLSRRVINMWDYQRREMGRR